MKRTMAMRVRAAGGRWCLTGILVLAAAACGAPDEEGAAEAELSEAAEELRDTVEAYIRPTAEGGELVQGDTVPGHPSWTEQDREVLRSISSWAWENGVDRMPVGERVARIGEAFIGTDYIPQTLDPEGPERLVVNLRALDCVTFVENALALAHFVRLASPDVLEEGDRAMELYADLLSDIRYRGGEMDGYPSRLHYFSEWIADAERKGYVNDVTDALGGVEDDEPITFMTEHRDAYRQLEDPEVFQAIARVEERLSQRPRTYIPQARVVEAHDGIRDGDIIALTSTLDGLDVAHTGIAVWRDGAPRLLNAPLVGEEVHVSEASLADRLAGISAQDGMIVARPLETDRVRGRF